MTTQFDLANRALALVGTRSQITDFSSTPEGLYCGLLYSEFRDYLLREGDYDFALSPVPAVPFGLPSPGWAFVYQYPVACVRIRQLVPLNPNPFDPQPIQWNISSNTSVLTTVAIATMNITTNAALETVWDASFTDAFVRFLASGLAFALENRIEAHKVAIQEALNFAAQGAVVNP